MRELKITDEVVRARCELDDGWRTLEVSLPAVLSVAERLTEPCKVPAQQRAEVPAERISTLRAADLGPGPWGAAGSPTVVGAIRTMEIERRRLVLSGSVAEQVAEAVRLLQESGAIERRVHADESVHAPGAEPAVDVVGPAGKAAPDGPIVAVVVEPERARVARELLRRSRAPREEHRGRCRRRRSRASRAARARLDGAQTQPRASPAFSWKRTSPKPLRAGVSRYGPGESWHPERCGDARWRDVLLRAWERGSPATRWA